jgi:hypothetical protein
LGAGRDGAQQQSRGRARHQPKTVEPVSYRARRVTLRRLVSQFHSLFLHGSCSENPVPGPTRPSQARNDRAKPNSPMAPDNCIHPGSSRIFPRQQLHLEVSRHIAALTLLFQWAVSGRRERWIQLGRSDGASFGGPDEYRCPKSVCGIQN